MVDVCVILDDFGLILGVVFVGVEGVKVENVAERKKWRERENDWVDENSTACPVLSTLGPQESPDQNPISSMMSANVTKT